MKTIYSSTERDSHWLYLFSPNMPDWLQILTHILYGGNIESHAGSSRETCQVELDQGSHSRPDVWGRLSATDLIAHFSCSVLTKRFLLQRQIPPPPGRRRRLGPTSFPLSSGSFKLLLLYVTCKVSGIHQSYVNKWTRNIFDTGHHYWLSSDFNHIFLSIIFPHIQFLQ